MSQARTSRGRVLAYTMIVADSECHSEIKGYLPFTRGGVAGPETREVSNSQANPLSSSHGRASGWPGLSLVRPPGSGSEST